MTRVAYLAAIAALLSGPAAAQTFSQGYSLDGKDALAKLTTDCGAVDLAEASVDSCLERARVLDETNPSPDVEVLEAKLEQRASQSFNPNGVDQGSQASRAETLAQIKANQSAAPEPPDPTDPPLMQLPPSEAAEQPDQTMNPADMDTNDVPPVQDDDSKMSDGPPPDVTTEDVPPPDDPPPSSDDDPGPGH